MGLHHGLEPTSGLRRGGDFPGGAPLYFALPLDSSSDTFCEIISAASKNIRRRSAKLHEIIPAQFQPRIDLLELKQDNFPDTLPRRVEGAAYFRFVPSPHSRN